MFHQKVSSKMINSCQIKVRSFLLKPVTSASYVDNSNIKTGDSSKGQTICLSYLQRVAIKSWRVFNFLKILFGLLGWFQWLFIKLNADNLIEPQTPFFGSFLHIWYQQTRINRSISFIQHNVSIADPSKPVHTSV